MTGERQTQALTENKTNGCDSWAAQYDTWHLINLMPKGVDFVFGGVYGCDFCMCLALKQYSLSHGRWQAALSIDKIH